MRSFCFCNIMAKDIRIERWSGPALEQFIPELARLRIEVFRDFPYLYDGDMIMKRNIYRLILIAPKALL